MCLLHLPAKGGKGPWWLTQSTVLCITLQPALRTCTAWALWRVGMKLTRSVCAPTLQAVTLVWDQLRDWCALTKWRVRACQNFDAVHLLAPSLHPY